MEKMPYCDEVKNDLNFIENPVPTLIGASIFGLISFRLMIYLFIVFLHPKINSLS